MKNKDILNLNESFKKLANLRGIKFAFAVAKNKRKLAEAAESLMEAIKESDKFAEYEEKRKELAKQFSKKNEKGDPVIERDGNQSHFVLEDEDSFRKELELLRSEYKESVDEREKQIEDFEALLKEESDVVLFKIPLSEVPEDITVDQMEIAYSFIEMD